MSAPAGTRTTADQQPNTAGDPTEDAAAGVALEELQAGPVVRRRRRGGRKITDLLLPLAVIALLLAVWYFVTYVVLDARRRFILPAPHTIITDALFDQRTMDKVLPALWRTIQVTFTGLAIAIVIGMIWAIIMSQAKAAERALFPYAVALQCVPILALVPLMAFWFGYGFNSRVIVCVLISLFPIVSNTLFGLQSVDRSMHELFTLHNASRMTRLLKLQMPAAMPAIFAGFRISAGLSVVGAIVGDLFFKQGQAGLGILLSNFSSRLQGQELFLTIFIAAGLGFAVFAVFGWLGKLAVGRWYDQARDAG